MNEEKDEINMIKKMTLVAVFALPLSTAGFAACDSCGPYKLKLHGDNATALHNLTSTIDTAGFTKWPTFSFRWDGEKVLYTSTYTPKAKGKYEDVYLYDKLSQRFTGYINESDLGGQEAKKCLNDYSFSLMDDSRLYGSPMLSSMSLISTPEAVMECANTIDLSKFLGSQALFIKRDFIK